MWELCNKKEEMLKLNTIPLSSSFKINNLTKQKLNLKNLIKIH